MSWEKGGIGSFVRNSNGVDEWGEGHTGSLALIRTGVGFFNLLLTTIVILMLR